MKLTGLFCFLILLGGTAASQDIRSKVISGNSGIAISNILDPQTGVFGVPFATTEDQLIRVFGQPSGYFSLMNDVSMMAYGYRTLFVFRAKQLIGVTLADYMLPYDIRGIVRPSEFDHLAWSLTNGIRAQTSLLKVKQILALPDLQITSGQRVVFEQDGTTIVLILGRQMRFDGTGKEMNDFSEADYSVDSVYVVRTSALPYLAVNPMN